MAKRKVVEKKPHFLKVLLGDFSQRLRIPPKFVKQFSGEYAERAILEGPTGGIWAVELQRTSKGIYLSEGWQNFVKDNALRGLELLLFRYDGRMHFNVSVFDTTACEREYVLPGEGSASRSKGLRKHRVSRKDPQMFGCHILAGQSRNGQANSINSKCLKLPQINMETKIEADDLPLSAIGVLPSWSMLGSSPDALAITPDALAITRGVHHPTSTKSRSQSERRPQRKTLAGCFLSQRRPVSKEERERACQAAESFTSTFPFFIAHMKISSVYRIFLLGVPTSFAKAHLPRTKTELVLEDPTGRTWPVMYIPNIESRFSGGWVAFAKGNNLEEGDFCVFELVRPFELHVHIFRVVEEITPLIKACSTSQYDGSLTKTPVTQ